MGVVSRGTVQPRPSFLRACHPAAMAGYSIHVYRISPEEAKRVRRQMELTRELPDVTIQRIIHVMDGWFSMRR